MCYTVTSLKIVCFWQMYVEVNYKYLLQICQSNIQRCDSSRITGRVPLVAISGTNILVPHLKMKSLNLICISGTCRYCIYRNPIFHTLRPRQDGRHFPDDIFKCIFLNENVLISIKISLKFVPKGPINNIPALVQIMAWRRSGNKPLSEPMMVR